MKSLITLLPLISCLLSCTNSKEIHNEELKSVKVNGIYIASDPYAFIVEDQTSMKLIPSQESVQIIRFLNQNTGIIIQWSKAKKEVYTHDKIVELYNWCKEYEKKNPEDKEYIHFTLLPAAGDSIRFVQSTSHITTTYSGINAVDSLLLKYDIDLDDKEKTITPMNRKLTFKFYQL